MQVRRAPAGSLRSIMAIVVSMAGVAIGNGLMLAHVPFVLSRSGGADWAPGAAVSAMALGGLGGCVLAGPLIRRVGHARAFSCSLAIVILSAVIISLGIHPMAWVFARGLYGVAANINFIIALSWLNHASENHWRGKAMSFFYMAYVFCLGFGAWLFGQIPAAGNLTPIATIFFTTIALLPIGLTRLATPPAPAKVSVDVAMAWRISPVALVGILASGGISMVVQGFTPIYAAANDVGQKDIAALMFGMQFGLFFVQYPLGLLSDRIDRRVVLIITCLLIAGVAVAALGVSFSNLLLLILVFAIWAGAAESVYSIANAHANDRADPAEFVPLASTLLVAWSVAATVVPLGITLLTPVLGPKTFIYTAAIVAVAYAGFVLLRLRTRETVPAAEREHFELRSGQLPNAGALVEAAGEQAAGR